MITGFNTDVKHRNRVFHIQTEDKGDMNLHVESLVYVGGEILATKKTSYADAVQEGRDDHAVQELMEQQHRTMIAAIQRGRFDGPNGSIQIPDGMASTASRETPASTTGSRKQKGDDTAPPGTASPLPASDHRSLDQMILEYLVSDDVPDEVALALSPTPEFQAGRSIQTKLKATSGSPPRALAGAVVQVRILSTVARTSTVFSGKTATDGSCPVSFMVPAQNSGTAAVIFRVTSPDASAEVQFPIKKK